MVCRVPGEKCTVPAWVPEGCEEWPQRRTGEGTCGGQSPAPYHLIWSLENPVRGGVAGPLA